MKLIYKTHIPSKSDRVKCCANCEYSTYLVMNGNKNDIITKCTKIEEVMDAYSLCEEFYATNPETTRYNDYKRL